MEISIYSVALSVILFLYETVKYFTIVIRDGDKVELGALFSHYLFRTFSVTLGADLRIQYITAAYSRAGWKILYLIQVLLTLLIAIYMNETIQNG